MIVSGVPKGCLLHVFAWRARSLACGCLHTTPIIRTYIPNRHTRSARLHFHFQRDASHRCTLIDHKIMCVRASRRTEQFHHQRSPVRPAVNTTQQHDYIGWVLGWRGEEGLMTSALAPTRITGAVERWMELPCRRLWVVEFLFCFRTHT